MDLGTKGAESRIKGAMMRVGSRVHYGGILDDRLEFRNHSGGIWDHCEVSFFLLNQGSGYPIFGGLSVQLLKPFRNWNFVVMIKR